MAWNEVEPMEQRVRFVFLIRDKEKSFAEACRDFGISRPTGYKWWRRFKRLGLVGLEERSSRPKRCPKSTSLAWRQRILLLRKERPHWGPKKLRKLLLVRTKSSSVPACSTIGHILAMAGLVRRRGRRRPAGPLVARPGLTTPTAANDIWAVDFKGWFRLGNGERCEPLTVSDLYSRYVLCCEACSDVSYNQAFPIFHQLFAQQGLPSRIRVDNGPPFGSRGAAGISRLTAWWVSLGIIPEFIDPGHPEQNGSHERMHRTLKAEAIKPVAHYRQRQQRRFDEWRWVFNHERPHEALGQVTPSSLYHASPQQYKGSITPTYPADHIVRRVRSTGEINWKGRKRFIGEAFVRHSVGVVQIGPGRNHVYFYNYLLGELQDDQPMGLMPVVRVR